MDFNIEDFLPKYPNVNNYLQDVLNPYPDFYQSTYEKKEFNDLRLSYEEPRPRNGEYYKHQKFIARFLSSHTLYNALLLDHEMGTGKSCSAFAAIEYIKETNKSFKGALVLTRGPRILANLMKELAYVCTPGQYVPDELERNLTDKERKRRLTKLVSAFYKFATFEKFAKSISRLSDTELGESYSNMIIVIDEVHNLRIREESVNYKQIHRLLHTVKNCKIIIMSGTPMKDDPSEIAAMLNLILPRDKQLPVEEEFNRTFMTSHGSGLKKYYTMKPEKINALKEYMKGHVSFLKTMNSSVKVEYRGEKMGSLKYFKVFPSKMSALQSKAYNAAYNLDVQSGDTNVEKAKNEALSSGIYSNSRQATLFVFPKTLMYGKEGFDKGFKKVPHKKFFRYIPTPEFSSLRGTTTAETIANIKQYSSIYGSIIESILANPKKLHFIYNSFVHGSGSIVLGRLLEMVGFRHSNGTETEQSPRYAILTGTNISPQSVERIIKHYNKPENRYGQYIQVIIGSKILTEGITLKNVQEIHITTPHWNYAELAQAIARGIRLESHSDLVKDGVVPVVQVYQHVAIPTQSTAPSLDLEMYELCESKDISIKAVERVMKESAVDCALFYDRNRVRNGEDGTRECDYQRCDYKCDGIADLNPVNIDYSTYNLYYKERTDVSFDIVKIFKTKNLIPLDEFLAVLAPKYQPFDIFSELNKMIIDNVPVKNSLDVECYIREKNNVLFLVDSIVSGDDFFSNMYTSNPVTTDFKSRRDACDILYMQNIKDGIDVTYAFERLSFNTKRTIIEVILEQKLSNRVLSARSQELYVYLAPSIKNEDKTYMLDGVAFCYEDGEWEPCTYEEEQPEVELPFRVISEDDFDREKATAEYGYAGQYNKKNKKFCIEKLSSEKFKDVRRKTTGINCETAGISKLILISVALGIDTDPLAYKLLSREELIGQLSVIIDRENLEKLSDDELRRARYFRDITNKRQRCELIRNFMASHYLLYESEGCGVQGRTKKD